MAIIREKLKNTDFSDIATGENMPPLHPGVFLREMLEDFGVSQVEFANASGISAMRVSRMIDGARPVTVELALWFGRVFGQSPQCRIDLQAAL